MSDETTQKGESDEQPVGGERLRVARRANDISVRDVAKELHLDEHKVRALEKNEFDVLGAPVFAKGHLRKYAEMVGVAVDDVMTDYYQMNRATGAPPVVGTRKKPPRDINLFPWAVGIVVVLVVAGATWWWLGPSDTPPAPVAAPGLRQPADRTPEAAEAAAETPEPEAPAAGTEPDAGSPQPAQPEPDAGAVEPAAADSAEYQPTPGVPQVDIVLSFSGECWTEVTDASGRKLFYDLGASGRVVSLTGDAPLRLILGDADNVSITVDGQAWPIPSSSRRGQLARLTIAAQ